MCVPDGDSYRCHAGLPDVGCPPYNISNYGVILGANSWSKDVYPVGSYIQVGCEYPYVTTHGNPDNVWSIHCTDRKTWPPSKRCVSVAELCNYKILENKLYPSRVQISTTSAIPGWEDSEILLESGMGWIASQNDEHQYIQITLDNAYWIGGLATKGGIYTTGTEEARWVTVYNVAYSIDCSDYAFVMDADHNYPQVFQANSDATSSVTNHFERQKLIKCLRVYPQGFHRGIIMRLELLACKKI